MHSAALVCVGVQLRQLCSTFHVDITMPPKDGKEDTTVLLQGYEERCRQAADEIQQIIDRIVSAFVQF